MIYVENAYLEVKKIAVLIQLFLLNAFFFIYNITGNNCFFYIKK